MFFSFYFQVIFLQSVGIVMNLAVDQNYPGKSRTNCRTMHFKMIRSCLQRDIKAKFALGCSFLAMNVVSYSYIVCSYKKLCISNKDSRKRIPKT